MTNKPDNIKGWQPISTAPRDGTRFLVYTPAEDIGYRTGTFARIIGYYAPKYTLECHHDCDPEKYPKLFDFHEESGEYYAKEGFYADCFENYYGDEIAKAIHPIKWQPLPAPPEEGKE